MKRTIPLIIILMLGFFLLVSTASAQEPEPQKTRPKAKLGLTPEQKEKMKETRLNFEKEKIRLKADLKIAKLELRSLMAEEELDKVTIYRKIEQIGELKTKLTKNQLDKRMAIREILTKEQLEILKEFKFRKMKRGKLMQGRMHRLRPLRQRPLPSGRPGLQGMMEKLPPGVEQAPITEPEGSFLEPAELAELAQLMDELELLPPPDLAEIAPLLEEMELLPLTEEDLPSLFEQPEPAPLLEEE